MHYRRMRTARLLTVSPSMHSSGGEPCLGGTWSRGCTWSKGVYLVLGVPGLGCVPGPGGTWSKGVPGPGVYLVQGGVPGLGWGVYLVREGYSLPLTE